MDPLRGGRRLVDMSTGFARVDAAIHNDMLDHKEVVAFIETVQRCTGWTRADEGSTSRFRATADGPLSVELAHAAFRLLAIGIDVRSGRILRRD